MVKVHDYFRNLLWLPDLRVILYSHPEKKICSQSYCKYFFNAKNYFIIIFQKNNRVLNREKNKPKFNFKLLFNF